MAGYADIAFADTYLANQSAWTAASAAVKQDALDLGRTALDASVTWKDGVTPGDEDAVKQANCWLALAHVDGTGIWPDKSQPVVEESARTIGPLTTRTRYRFPAGSRSSPLARFPKAKALLEAADLIVTAAHGLMRA